MSFSELPLDAISTRDEISEDDIDLKNGFGKRREEERIWKNRDYFRFVTFCFVNDQRKGIIWFLQ